MSLVATELASLNDTQLQSMQKDLQFLIGQMATRIAYAETRRNTLAVIGSALVAASVALLTLTLTKISGGILLLPMLILSSGGIAVGVLTWLVYMMQTNFRYPFTQVTKTWKWFYRYALTDHEAFRAGTIPYQRKGAFEDGKKAFERQWEAFVKQQVDGLSELRTSVAQDLEQVYLLHVNERYKNLFLTKLRNVLVRGIAVVVSAFLITVASTASGLLQWADGSNTVHHSRRSGVEAAWRETGMTRSSASGQVEVQILANLRVESPQQVTTSNVVGRDDHGLFVPLFVESLQSVPNAPGSWVILAWLPSSLRPQISSIEIQP